MSPWHMKRERSSSIGGDSSDGEASASAPPLPQLSALRATLRDVHRVAPFQALQEEAQRPLVRLTRADGTSVDIVTRAFADLDAQDAGSDHYYNATKKRSRTTDMRYVVREHRVGLMAFVNRMHDTPGFTLAGASAATRNSFVTLTREAMHDAVRVVARALASRDTRRVFIVCEQGIERSGLFGILCGMVATAATLSPAVPPSAAALTPGAYLGYFEATTTAAGLRKRVADAADLLAACVAHVLSSGSSGSDADDAFVPPSHAEAIAAACVACGAADAPLFVCRAWAGAPIFCGTACQSTWFAMGNVH